MPYVSHALKVTTVQLVDWRCRLFSAVQATIVQKAVRMPKVVLLQIPHWSIFAKPHTTVLLGHGGRSNALWATTNNSLDKAPATSAPRAITASSVCKRSAQLAIAALDLC